MREGIKKVKCGKTFDVNIQKVQSIHIGPEHFRFNKEKCNGCHKCFFGKEWVRTTDSGDSVEWYDCRRYFAFDRFYNSHVLGYVCEYYTGFIRD